MFNVQAELTWLMIDKLQHAHGEQHTQCLEEHRVIREEQSHLQRDLASLIRMVSMLALVTTHLEEWVLLQNEEDQEDSTIRNRVGADSVTTVHTVSSQQ